MRNNKELLLHCYYIDTFLRGCSKCSEWIKGCALNPMNYKEIMQKKLYCILWRSLLGLIWNFGNVMHAHKRKAPWTCPHQYRIKFIGRRGQVHNVHAYLLVLISNGVISA